MLASDVVLVLLWEFRKQLLVYANMSLFITALWLRNSPNASSGMSRPLSIAG